MGGMTAFKTGDLVVLKSGSMRMCVEAVNEDMYAAIDALLDKLDRQVIKHKEKIKRH